MPILIKRWKKENTCHRIAVNPAETGALSLCQINEPKNQYGKKQQHKGRTEEALLFAYSAEYKVGLAPERISALSGFVQEALAQQSARPDGYLTLVYIVSCTCRIVFHPQQHFDTGLLMSFQALD